MVKPSIVLISRLPIHGKFLLDLLSHDYDVTWIGRNLPSLNAFNLFFILFKEFYELITCYSKKSYSLIIVQFVSIDGIVALLLKRVFGIALVLFAIGSDVMRAEEHAVAFSLLKKVITSSDYIFCVNSSIEKKLQSIGYETAKMKIVPSVISTTEFQELHCPKEYDIITVGNLDFNKNHKLLINACKLLHNVRVLIVGEGPMRHSLEQDVADKGLNVVFAGVIPHCKVFVEMQKSQIYVHTARKEGSPAVLFEAMFCGVPIVLVQSDYVEDFRRRYGFVVHTVKNDSAKELAREIKAVLENYSDEVKIALINKRKVLTLMDEEKYFIKNTLTQILLIKRARQV